MDTGSRGQLLAANMEIDEIRSYLDVDTLAYLTLDGLVTAIGAPGAGFCNACLTGEYPVEITPNAARGVLAEPAEPAVGPGEVTLSLLEGFGADAQSAMLPADQAARQRSEDHEDVRGG